MKINELSPGSNPTQGGFWSGLKAGLTGQETIVPANAPQAASQAAPQQVANPFSSPETLLSSFKSYVEAGGKISPRLRGAVKDIWMQMGGIRAESKNK